MAVCDAKGMLLIFKKEDFSELLSLSWLLLSVKNGLFSRFLVAVLLKRLKFWVKSESFRVICGIKRMR